jgi:hypothetical protein
MDQKLGAMLVAVTIAGCGGEGDRQVSAGAHSVAALRRRAAEGSSMVAKHTSERRYIMNAPELMRAYLVKIQDPAAANLTAWARQYGATAPRSLT